MLTIAVRPRGALLAILAGLVALAPRVRAQDHSVRECPAAPESPARVSGSLESLGGPQTTVATVVPIKGMALWLALTRLPARDLASDYGWRVALLADSGSVAVIRAVSAGEIDSYRPIVRVFDADSVQLVLVQLGDEGGSWGIDTYEVRSLLLLPLGKLDIGRPTEENDQYLIGDVVVERTTADWQVGATGPVVLHPNQRTRRVIRGAPGAKIWFTPSPKRVACPRQTHPRPAHAT